MNPALTTVGVCSMRRLQSPKHHGSIVDNYPRQVVSGSYHPQLLSRHSDPVLNSPSGIIHIGTFQQLQQIRSSPSMAKSPYYSQQQYRLVNRGTQPSSNFVTRTEQRGSSLFGQIDRQTSRQQLALNSQQVKLSTSVVKKFQVTTGQKTKPSTQESRMEVVGLVRQLGEIIGWPGISLSELRNKLAACPELKSSRFGSSVFGEHSIINMIEDQSNIQGEECQLKTAYYQLQKQIYMLRSEQDLMRQNNENLTQAVRVLTQDTHRQQQQNGFLKGQFKGSRRSTQQHSSEVSVLKEKLSQLQEIGSIRKTQSQQQRPTSQKQSTSQLSNQTQVKYKIVISDLEVRNQKLNYQLGIVQEQYSNLQRHSLEQLKTQRIEAAQELELKMHQRDQENKRLLEAKNFLEQGFRGIKDTLQQLRYQNQGLRNSNQECSQVQTVTAYCQQLQAQLVATKSKYESIQLEVSKSYDEPAQTSRLNARLLELQSQLHMKAEEINLWRKDSDQFRQTCQGLTALNSRLKEDNHSLTKRIQSAQADVLGALRLAQERQQDSTSLVSKLQSNVRSQTDNLSELIRDKKVLHEQLALCRDQIQKYRQVESSNNYPNLKSQFQEMVRQVKAEYGVRIGHLEAEVRCREQSLCLVQRILQQTRGQQLKEIELAEQKTNQISRLKSQVQMRSKTERDQLARQLTQQIRRLEILLDNQKETVHRLNNQRHEQMESLIKRNECLQKENCSLVEAIHKWEAQYNLLKKQVQTPKQTGQVEIQTILRMRDLDHKLVSNKADQTTKYVQGVSLVPTADERSRLQTQGQSRPSSKLYRPDTSPNIPNLERGATKIQRITRIPPRPSASEVPSRVQQSSPSYEVSKMPSTIPNNNQYPAIRLQQQSRNVYFHHSPVLTTKKQFYVGSRTPQKRCPSISVRPQSGSYRRVQQAPHQSSRQHRLVVDTFAKEVTPQTGIRLVYPQKVPIKPLTRNGGH